MTRWAACLARLAAEVRAPWVQEQWRALDCINQALRPDLLQAEKHRMRRSAA